jgi:hypothetical protein
MSKGVKNKKANRQYKAIQGNTRQYKAKTRAIQGKAKRVKAKQSSHSIHHNLHNQYSS